MHSAVKWKFCRVKATGTLTGNLLLFPPPGQARLIVHFTSPAEAASRVKGLTEVFTLHEQATCDPTYQNESKRYCLPFWVIYIAAESTKFSLKSCKNYQNRSTGLVIITSWSCNHHSILCWETDKNKVFIIQSSATSMCKFKTPFNDIIIFLNCEYGQ